MAETFFSLLTSVGAARLSNALALNQTVNITELAVGDGEAGAYYTPTEAQTALKNEVYRGAINNKYQDTNNANWAVFELAIPADTVAFTIREAGIFDDGGNMIAVAKLPETYKPALAEGSGKDLLIKFVLQTSNAAQVDLLVDPSAVLATHQKVANDIGTHNTDTNAHTTASETAKGFVELATVTEAKAGTDTARAVTPAGLNASLVIPRKTALLNALLDAMQAGVSLRVFDAVADPYADLSKVNTLDSSSYQHNAAGAYIEPSAQTMVPGATGTAFVEGDATIGDAPNAFDGDTGTSAFVGNSGGSTWMRIGKDWGGISRTISGVRFHGPHKTLNATTVTAELQGSNDGVIWTNLGNFSFDSSAAAWFEKMSGLDEANAYTYHALYITGGDGTGRWAYEVEFYEQASQDATVISTVVAATAEPSVGYFLALIEPVDAVTYNVDFTADLSKDGGTSWEAVAVEKVGVTDEGYDVVFGSVTFVAAGSQDIASRWQTFNAKAIKNHGIITDAEG